MAGGFPESAPARINIRCKHVGGERLAGVGNIEVTRRRGFSLRRDPGSLFLPDIRDFKGSIEAKRRGELVTDQEPGGQGIGVRVVFEGLVLPSGNYPQAGPLG